MNRDRLALMKASLSRIGVTPAAPATTSAELPYFGHPGDWEKWLPKPNEALTWTRVKSISACTSCGGLMVDSPGAHAPRHSANPLVVVDCVGRPCVKDAAGYYQVAAP